VGISRISGPASVRTNVASPPREKSQFAYRIMLVFSFLYFFRPGDIIPGLSALHLAKITGALAVLALLLGTNKTRLNKLPVEIKIIFAMFGWMILTIPFAYWQGGSMGVVFFEFSKAVIVALTLTFAVTRIVELQRLIMVQALGVTLMTVVAAIVNNRMQGRLAGVGDGLLSNPNDLAMNIALNWPLCLVFLLRSRGIVKKIFWAVCMLIMIYALMATYSRAGFMALGVAILFCLWDFGIRGRRGYMVAIAVICVLVGVAVAPGNYAKRLGTLVGKFQEGDFDNGSAEARKELLLQSLKVTATHPLFGVGPGNFQSYTGSWRVTHNTYTQFSSECGIPALLLFLVLMWRAFLNLRATRRLPFSEETEEVHMYASALSAALAAYILGAFFSSSGYELFPYYLVMYTTLLYRLALQQQNNEATTLVKPPVQIGRRVYSPMSYRQV